MHRLLRPSVSPRRLLLLAVALVVGAGLGLGAAALWSPSDRGAAPIPRAQAAPVVDPAATEPTEPTEPTPPDEGAAPEDVPESEPPAPAEVPTPPEAPASPRLTLDEAKAIALKAAGPGRVVEIDDDDEPTGLRYDVTILHDNRTSTDVEVDATTGEITSIKHDDDWD
jgi:hypothetical protein